MGFSELNPEDEVKLDGLNGMTVLTRTRYYRETSPYLHLNLGERVPQICLLMYPMAIKMPIISVQFYLDLNLSVTFNSIRKSKHEYASDLISYLYEVLFIQQKIAISLHEYLRLTDYAQRLKKDALFINAEINAIMGGDLVFSYLKASIEKIIVIVGLTHKIANLESKKTHKAKLNALTENMPSGIQELWYYKFLFEFISSENLDELNNYRSGLLHKRGIADLQPHHYVGAQPKDIPLVKIFNILLEQHAKNTSVLIAAIALLTDELVRLDAPTEEEQMKFYQFAQKFPPNLKFIEDGLL